MYVSVLQSISIHRPCKGCVWWTQYEDNPRRIQYIKNPAKEVQLAVVRRLNGFILPIVNPCEEAQIAAIQMNPEMIKYIENPTKNALKFWCAKVSKQE